MANNDDAIDLMREVSTLRDALAKAREEVEKWREHTQEEARSKAFEVNRRLAAEREVAKFQAMSEADIAERRAAERARDEARAEVDTLKKLVNDEGDAVEEALGQRDAAERARDEARALAEERAMDRDDYKAWWMKAQAERDEALRTLAEARSVALEGDGMTHEQALAAVVGLVADLREARAALRWVANNYEATLGGKSVRDADECLCAARRALDDGGSR